MSFEDIIPAFRYSQIHYFTVFLISVITALFYVSDENSKIHKDVYGKIFAILLFLAVSIFWGLRPTYSKVFGDTWLYAYSYENMFDNPNDQIANTEWLWNQLNYFCRYLGFSTSAFFVTLEFLYVGFMLWTCHRLMGNNLCVGFLFCITSYSFLSYGVNGIRNGLACSTLMLAISFLNNQNKWSYLMSGLFVVIANGLHASAIIPTIALFFSFLFINSTQKTIFIWIISILLSLILGNSLIQFIPDFGLDTSRFDNYIIAGEDNQAMEKFTSGGFRFDFLLYSVMPILMIWYVTIKRNFVDLTYNIIANTYILANAFWIIVIRASYSNRFAYLSWFLYPLVIAYPLIRFNLWEDQDKKAALILFVYASFTFIMFLLGK